MIKLVLVEIFRSFFYLIINIDEEKLVRVMYVLPERVE